MKRNKSNAIPDFGKSSFLKAVIPSYVAPFIMSLQGGYFSNNPTLMKASYSTIAVPSLISTIICFFILREFQRRQTFIINKFTMALVLAIAMVSIASITIIAFELQDYTFDIIPSVILGAVIVSLTKPLKKINYYYEN